MGISIYTKNKYKNKNVNINISAQGCFSRIIFIG